MSKVFIRTEDPEDWKKLLAEPEKQWKTGYSAKALAYCWQKADGFPERVKSVFKRSSPKLFHDIEVLLALPEYQVSLPGGVRPSQNDIFVLARSGDQLVCIMVEGKVSEPFGRTVAQWREDTQGGKENRLEFLLKELGLEDNDEIGPIRYQLLHRTASAMLEAKRFQASSALMLVHSFSQAGEWLGDYKDFLRLFGVEGGADSILFGKKLEGIDLYFGWVKGDEKYLRAPEADEEVDNEEVE